MKLSFQPGSVLLDKGVVRRVYEARVRLALGQPPTLLQAEATNVWSRLRTLNIPLYITEQTAHILQRRSPLFAAVLLAQTQALRSIPNREKREASVIAEMAKWPGRPGRFFTQTRHRSGRAAFPHPVPQAYGFAA